MKINNERDLIKIIMSNVTLSEALGDDEMSEDLLDKIFDLLDSDEILKTHVTLSEGFIKKHLHSFDLGVLGSYLELSEDLIEYIIDKADPSPEFYQNITYSNKRKLSESFLRKHIAKLNPRNVSLYQNLSEDFIRDHKKYLYWKHISYAQKLSESFIIEHKDLVDWQRISGDQKISLEFIEAQEENISFRFLSQNNKSLTYDVLLKYKDKLTWNQVSRNIILEGDDIPEELISYINWNMLCLCHRDLSKDFVLKYKDYIDAYHISLTQPELYDRIKHQLQHKKNR